MQSADELPVRQTLLAMRRLMFPIMAILFITGFLNANIVNYLPTFMSREGAAFALAGASLAIVELSGTVGVLLMSLYSDRFGHRNIALLGGRSLSGFCQWFLDDGGLGQTRDAGWYRIKPLSLTRLFWRWSRPEFRNSRSLSNGVYMSSSFILRSVVVVIVGVLADRYGMRPVFLARARWFRCWQSPLFLCFPKNKNLS